MNDHAVAIPNNAPEISLGAKISPISDIKKSEVLKTNKNIILPKPQYPKS